MNRLFKIAMLWLLALALPVQGFAAVTQSSCAPQMQTQHIVAASEGIPDSVHSHHPIATDGIEHRHHHMSTSAEQAGHVDADKQTGHQDNKHANVKCSACATCCVGIAMLPAMPQLPAFPIASTLVVSSLSAFPPGHIPDGLKRPPKFFLV
jgi:hypothetical protein